MMPLKLAQRSQVRLSLRRWPRYVCVGVFSFWAMEAFAESPSVRDDAVPSMVDWLAGEMERRVDAHPLRLLDLHPAEIVDPSRPHRQGSLSFSNTSHGQLHGAKLLPDRGPHHHVLAQHLQRPTHWGTDELVDGILAAAAKVALQFPGTSTGVGNLSVKGGGDIPWSVSHNTGRDADVAFFFMDGRGNPVRVPTLVHVESDGHRARGHQDLFLDVARSWAFVEALVEDKALRVQWIFVSDPIRDRLLDYGRAQGASEATLLAASRVLRQPVNAAPHDDHFHLRVHCALDDRLDGCVEWGPRHDHLVYDDDAFTRRVDALLDGLRQSNVELANASFAYLAALEPRESGTQITDAILEVPPAFQSPLIRLATSLGGESVAHAFLDLLAEDLSLEQKTLLLRGLGGFALPSTAEALVRFAQSAEQPDSLRVEAVLALRANMGSPALLGLGEILDECSPEMEAAVDAVLTRLTLAPRPDAGTLAASWRAWLQTIEAPDSSEAWDALRGEWMEQGLKRAGYAIGQADAPNFGELIRALADADDPLAWNADRLLVRWTGLYSSAHRFDLRTKTRFWQRQTRNWPSATR